VTIYNDGYPSLEAYYSATDGASPQTVCQSKQGGPLDLAGSAGLRCEEVF
jgi:hypothetical protein